MPSRSFIALLSLTLLVFLGIAYLSQQCYIADSEIWAVTVARHLFTPETGGTSAYYKPLFYVLLSVTHLVSTTDIEILLHSRLIFAFLGTLLILVTTAIAKNLGLNRKETFLVLLFLITSSTFIFRGFRIRSDLLAALFSLCFVLLTLRSVKNSFQFKRSTNVKLTLINTALLLSTPKAVYFFLAELLWLLNLRQLASPKKTNLHNNLFSFYLPPLLILTVALVSSITQKVYLEAYLDAFDFFLRSFSEEFNASPYFSFQSFKYFIQFVSENPVLFLFSFISMGLVLRQRKRQQSSPLTIFCIYSITLSILFLLHNERYPFFIASILPSLSFLPIVLFRHLGGKPKFFLPVLYILLTLKGSVFAVELLKKNTNQKQLEYIQTLGEHLSHYPGSTYYDVLGILPTRRTLLNYIGVSDVEKKELILSQIKDGDTDFLIYTSRFIHLEPELGKLLNSERFYYLGGGLWAKTYFLKGNSEKVWKTDPDGYFYLGREQWKEYFSNENSTERILHEGREYRELHLDQLNSFLSKGQGDSGPYEIALGSRETGEILVKRKSKWMKMKAFEFSTSELKNKYKRILVPYHGNARLRPTLKLQSENLPFQLFTFDGRD